MKYTLARLDGDKLHVIAQFCDSLPDGVAEILLQNTATQLYLDGHAEKESLVCFAWDDGEDVLDAENVGLVTRVFTARVFA